MAANKITCEISSQGSGALEALMPRQIEKIAADLQQINGSLRRILLAILGSGIQTDNFNQVLETYSDFDVRLTPAGDYINLTLLNAPAEIMVDGRIITGFKELLFSAIRDVLFYREQLDKNLDWESPDTIKTFIFKILSHAKVIQENPSSRIVCWGGHAVGPEEYDYAKKVGYQLGLRGHQVITGCGHGIMKAPMKGATYGYDKEKISPRPSYIGYTEPGIIEVQPPNPIVDRLVILPDIEKRLETFVRTGHGILIFPGGPGTLEELMYILALLDSQKNELANLPLILTGPECSKEYWARVNAFVGNVLGFEAQAKYKIIINNPEKVAHEITQEALSLIAQRSQLQKSRHFNWDIQIPPDLQRAFNPTHENVAGLKVDPSQSLSERAQNMRKILSAIVAGSVKEAGIQAIEEKGKFQIQIDPCYAEALSDLLEFLVRQNRAKIGDVYELCQS